MITTRNVIIMRAWLQSEWKRFRRGPRFEFWCLLGAVMAASAVNVTFHRVDPRALPCVANPYAWVWGLFAVCGVLLLAGRRAWGGYVTVLIGCATSLCYLRVFAEFLQDLPFELGVAALVAFLVLLRRVCCAWRKLYRVDAPPPRERDSLGRGRVYAAVHARIRKQSAEHGAVFAIYGAWGSGKTHLLHYLESRLRSPFAREQKDDPAVGETGLYSGAYAVGHVQLWQYHNNAEAMTAMADALFRAVTPTWPVFAAPVPRLCCSFLSKLLGIEDERIRQLLVTLVEAGDVAETKMGEINDYLAVQGRRAVLVIEDVERAEIEVIEHLLPLLERLKRISSLTVLCALDPDELARKCGASRMVAGALQGYLDKLFDMGFAMPPIPEELVDEYFSDYVAAHYSGCPHLVAFAAKSELRFRSPRQVERVAARLASTEGMYFHFPCRHGELHNIPMVFYVDVLRCLYHEAYRELSPLSRPANVLHDYLAKPDAELRKQIPLSVALMSQDETFRSLARALAKDHTSFSVGVKMAMAGYYTRRTGLLERDMEEIIRIWAQTPDAPVPNVVCRYLGVDSVERRAGVENGLTAFALQQVVENTRLREPAVAVLRSYLRRADRAVNLTESSADHLPGLITQAISGNALRALFLSSCADASDAVCRELYESVADKLSFGDVAEFRDLIREVRQGMVATDRTETTVKSIIELRDSTAFRAAASELDAYCCRRLLDYYIYLSDVSVMLREAFPEKKMYFYETSREDRRLMAGVLRRYLAAASTEEQVKLFIGWVRTLCGWVLLKGDGPGSYRGAPLNRARMLLPFLNAAAASAEFLQTLRAISETMEEPCILYAIRRMEKECASDRFTQDYFREHRFMQGTQRIINALNHLSRTAALPSR